MTRVPERPTDHGIPAGKRWRLGETPWRSAAPRGAKARVVIDNDFSGDPDDLFQLVHHLLSPGVEIRGVIASHLRPDDPLATGADTAADAAAVAHDVFARMGLESTELIHRGAPHALPDVRTPVDSPAARLIVEEAMRDDVDTPLFLAVGGGLTDLASAYLLEPAIAPRMTVVWIGGGEHDGLALPPPGGMPVEYNLLIDVVAGQVVFGAEGLPLWQVPRDVYRRCLVSDAELRHRVGGAGALGRYLVDEVDHEVRRVSALGVPASETYALGDSPLVLLTALRSLFEPDTTSSPHVERPTPALTAEGAYRPVRGARPMRVYTDVDVRLLLEDMHLKIEEFCRWQEGR